MLVFSFFLPITELCPALSAPDIHEAVRGGVKLKGEKQVGNIIDVLDTKAIKANREESVLDERIIDLTYRICVLPLRASISRKRNALLSMCKQCYVALLLPHSQLSVDDSRIHIILHAR